MKQFKYILISLSSCHLDKYRKISEKKRISHENANIVLVTHTAVQVQLSVVSSERDVAVR
jgi:hypothetical protein